MAYVSQELKTRIGVELKKVIPKGWKWTLAVRHHSTLELNIRSAPVDLMGEINRKTGRNDAHFSPYGMDFDRVLDRHVDLFKLIQKTMDNGNHDRSDPQTDYFDVGWYTRINIGSWDKPFKFIGVAA